MRIAALVKQVPAFETMELGPGGRLVREGIALELNPYCRRAVSKGVELAAATGGTCTAITLGPPSAEDCLREAVAWGCDEGILVSDPAFAGSDTLATAKALSATLAAFGPFDLVLAGRNSVDADTGQVGPQVAELTGMAFATGARELALGEGSLRVRCEEDDGYSCRSVSLPAVVSCAERLCDPAKVAPERRAEVDGSRLRHVTADELGPGPWGQAASPTNVGRVRVVETDRDRQILSGPVHRQVEKAVQLLGLRGAFDGPADVGAPVRPIGPTNATAGPLVAVAVEPGRTASARELLGAAHHLASEIAGRSAALVSDRVHRSAVLGSWGADEVVVVDQARSEWSIAAAVATWATATGPWAILLPGTTWGREVGGRVSATVGAGMTGDAVELDATPSADTGNPRLVAWKPAFGGRLVAAIHCSSAIQMASVRPGVLPIRPPRPPTEVPVTTVVAPVRAGVTIEESARDDDVDVLAKAHTIVGVGQAVEPADYPFVHELAAVLGAEMAATRKVTDRAWMPRARQIGITGRSVAPRLYVGVGLSGKFNHAVGIRGAGTVVAINHDPDAPIWDHADIGIVADWHEAVPLLRAAVERHLEGRATAPTGGARSTP